MKAFSREAKGIRQLYEKNIHEENHFYDNAKKTRRTAVTPTHLKSRAQWMRHWVLQRRLLDGLILGTLKAMERFDTVTGTAIFRMYKLFTPLSLAWDCLGISLMSRLALGGLAEVPCEESSAGINVLWFTSLIAFAAAIKRTIFLVVWIGTLIVQITHTLGRVNQAAEWLDQLFYNGTPVFKTCIFFLFNPERVHLTRANLAKLEMHLTEVSRGWRAIEPSVERHAPVSRRHDGSSWGFPRHSPLPCDATRTCYPQTLLKGAHSSAPQAI